MNFLSFCCKLIFYFRSIQNYVYFFSQNPIFVIRKKTVFVTFSHFIYHMAVDPHSFFANLGSTVFFNADPDPPLQNSGVTF